MKTTPPAIAIVGMACVYPDANTPGELWENVLAQRRAFRRVPPERLRLEDYFSADHTVPDSTYATDAAVIAGYEFDRVAFRVVGSTFRAADLAHWLALDIASRALADAGFAEGNGLPREATGVLIGNTLTGEFSRANALRLRWPYVRRTVEAALAKENFSAEQREKFLTELEETYKAPFPPVGEETLAGGLSNTIAGRICNQFNLKGGGYTVDGACASSLLATANACSALVAGDLDVAVAGGVDLSLDPFEIVGFAKTGALAPDDMRIFDKRSAGFWPGEGCGMVVLMRHEDALAQGRRVYAVIRGWGISSDGSGGMTRPEAEGQLEALRRAYRRAGFGVETVAYCEGHGTGTAVGDATELEVLSRARRETKNHFTPAVIGSVKANIGHTKAAAGIAGLIKATMAVHTQVLPPTTGCEQPHALLGGTAPALRVTREPEVWPQDRPLRASVSAMGFGGINAHLVVESVVAERRASLSAREFTLARSSQDAELFLFTAESLEKLAEQVKSILPFAAKISRAEMTDLATQLERNLGAGTFRAGVVAGKPAELAEKLKHLETRLLDGVNEWLDLSENIFVGSGAKTPRIGFLFPGQGSPTHLDGGVWRRRFESVRELYLHAGLSTDGDSDSTRIMQPAVVTASLAGLKVLKQLGIKATAAVGHSLGEITALHWAGGFDESALLRIAQVRGAAMADLGSPTGTMLAIAAPWEEVLPMLNGEPLHIVGYNSPRQTVVAGEADVAKKLARQVAARGWQASQLPVSHAFHTPLVAAAVPVLAGQLARENISGIQQTVFSTVTGARLNESEDLRELLCRQVTAPVRFSSALEHLSGAADLLIEVGPGGVLGGLTRDAVSLPVVSLDAGGNSLKGLLQAMGAAFALGAPVNTAALFADRFTRRFNLDWQPKFFANPCESAPVSDAVERRAPSRLEPDIIPQRAETVLGAPLELIRKLVAARAELPLASVRDESRMLSDLHLNSITVGQLISEAAKQLGLPRINGLTDFANASVAEIARAMDELKSTGTAASNVEAPQIPAGVAHWVRTFNVSLVETKRAEVFRKTSESAAAGQWQLFASEHFSTAELLKETLAKTGLNGVVLFLPENPGMEHFLPLLKAGRAALSLEKGACFVVIQHGFGGSGFAKTLHLENPGLNVCVINLPTSPSLSDEQIVSEMIATNGFVEVHFTEDERRLEPRLQLAEFSAQKSKSKFSLGADDVLLVTGGGKGIAAECALAFARETGVKLALIGRSDPKTDKELTENFARIAAAGVRSGYVRADVTDPKAVRDALVEIKRNLGPVTAVLHGAGVNTPKLIGALNEADFRRTLEPKIHGLENILAAVDKRKLKLLVTFGSIIARTGLPGEADYATANEWLAAMTEKFQAAHPRCRCLALEWSVWSGAGMGERLGRIESLTQHGITPITVDEGVRIFSELVRQPSSTTSLVVTGRFGAPPTLQMSEPELPLRRFLEHQRVFYPGVELVVDAELSLQADPYLADHVVQKQPLFPAVMGLEAMAQVVMALAGSTIAPIFENAEFLRPVAVGEKNKSTVRIAALRREDGSVQVCLRLDETDFQVDHFRATCRFEAQTQSVSVKVCLSPFEPELLALDPQTDLYGDVLFHRGRFCRLRGYQLLKAKECVAEITADDGAQWFGPYLPADFMLGNPAARDAALHAIQACIPHLRILPTGMERLDIFRHETGKRFVHAKERSRDGNNFIYDVEIVDAAGAVIERWSGLQLRAVETLTARGAWSAALLAPYLERRLEELAAPSSVRFAFARGLQLARQAGTDAVIQQALGSPARVQRRSDGKPFVAGGEMVSAAHANDFTLAVASAGEVACDLEEISERTEGVWRDLLGNEKFQMAQRIAREPGSNMDAAATTMWSVLECLKKIGLPTTAPLVMDLKSADGWRLFRSGQTTIATCAVTVQGNKSPLVMAVASCAQTVSRAPLAKPFASIPARL